MIFFICHRVWKTVKCQGKIREKSGNFEMDDKWQPCILQLYHLPENANFSMKYVTVGKVYTNKSSIK